MRRVSVALASYSGEKYIEAQIRSILENLTSEDELIISDDGSTDNTIEIIQRIADKRIILINGPKQGINQNFANAIQHCTGKYIFLSDQDDIWYPEKVAKVLHAFESGSYLVVQHDAQVADEAGNIIYPSFSKYRNVRTGFVKNYLRNSYHGCCMAFLSEIKDDILPMPKTGCFHDNWIGLIANMKGKTIFIDDVLIEYKRYDNNASSFNHYPFCQQLKNRLLIATNLILYFINSDYRV